MIEQLILVRHGETEHNVAGIAQGWNDSALSQRGTRQVRAIAERIAAMRPTAIYSSPLQRALTTAQTIAAACGLEVQTVDDLREMSYGAWENRKFLEVRDEYAAEYERWFSDPDVQCPDGESHNDVLRRMQRAFAAIERSANGEPGRAVVVTHGTAIRVAATIFLSAPVMSSRHLAQDNAALNLFIRRGDRWVLKLWNDTTHCHDPRTNQ